MTTRIDDNLLLDGAIVTCRHCGTILGDDHDPIRDAVVRESEPSEAGPGVRAAATNFAKSYRGAESWRPPAAYQCRFARSYVEVKASYDLTVTAAEREALSDMLDTC